MKRTLALLLAVLMLLTLLVGCASEPAATPSTDSQTPSDSAEPSEEPAEKPAEDEEPSGEPAEEPSGEPAEESAAEPASPSPLTLPIASELTTFTAWGTPQLIDATSGIEDIAETSVFVEAAKRTNVQFDFQYGPATDSVTAFSLMLASEDYTDLFVAGPNYLPRGEQMAIEEEIIIDLRPIIEEYCPNYYNIYTNDPSVRRVVTNDSGAVPGFRLLNVSPQKTYLGYFSTEAALESAGFSADNLPYTLDDYASVLEGCGGKIYLASPTGADFLLLSAFNTTGSFFGKGDEGVVVYGPATEEYRSYLELLSDWYSRGLVDPDYMSRTSYYVDSGVFMSGDVSIYPAPYNFISVYEDAGMNPVALPMPHINKGDVRYTSAGSQTDRCTFGNPCSYISAQCEDPVTLAKFYDYVYSDEGWLLFNYGVEGEGHTMVDGKPVLTDLVINNPELPFSKAISKYATITFFPHYYDWERELAMCTQSALDAQELWHSDRDMDIVYQQYGSLTPEETEAISSIQNDIDSYVSEFTNKVIVGEESLDNWDTFVAGLEQMNLQACIDAYQAAYDRYLAR